MVIMNDPEEGEGWNFIDDEDEVWHEAFETQKTEDGEIHIDVDAYDEFANIAEIVNFVAGQGTYDYTNSYTPSQEDLNRKKREMKNDNWKIPSKLEQIDEYLETGAMRGDINIDPTANAKWEISENDARQQDKETKYTAHFIVYNPEYEEENLDEGAYFYFSTSWYDTPPEKMNIEDMFDNMDATQLDDEEE